MVEFIKSEKKMYFNFENTKEDNIMTHEDEELFGKSDIRQFFDKKFN